MTFPRRVVALFALAAALLVPARAASAETVECSPACADYVTGLAATYATALYLHNLEVVARHYHPFLICTREHESAHGFPWPNNQGYHVVSSSGTYRGAYQFSQSTWDITAQHFGHWWLIGVDPATASIADQDLQAMRLHEWQGASPWLGRCA